MSPKRLPVASGARIVRALEKDGFKVLSGLRYRPVGADVAAEGTRLRRL